jgi:hypothetical protein
MTKFSAGDRVIVPQDKDHVPPELLDKKGTVTDIKIEGQNQPKRGWWEQEYVVRFDHDGKERTAREDWLDPAQKCGRNDEEFMFALGRVRG